MMDQMEFEDLVEKLKKRKEEGDIKNAVKVADRIPWDEVEDINLLMYVAGIYDEGKQYRDAKLILEYAYEVAPVKNRLYYSLCLINAKCKELKDAISYYTDFCESFPDDNRRLLLQYYIMNAKGASLNQQKRLLVEYLSEEKDEKMTFELALICDKLGEREETLEYCNFIINFFGVKKTGYGKNALLLKKKYVALTENEERLLIEAEERYEDATNSDVEYTEPPIFYNDVRLDSDKVSIPVEKVTRPDNVEDGKETGKEDELNEKDVSSSINITYTLDEESYSEKEKNNLAFMHDEKENKEKLKSLLIEELKKEEKKREGSFYRFREKSFERKGRLKDMKLSDTKLHMIIEAHSKDEGVDIAKGELNYIHSALGEKVPIAKASAYNINEKGFAFYEDKIKGKDLIIENAGMLKNEVMDSIEEYIINKKGTTLFALTDIINNFDKIAVERPSFIGRFDIYSVLSSRPQETLEVPQDMRKKESEPKKSFEEKNPEIKDKVEVDNKVREERPHVEEKPHRESEIHEEKVKSEAIIVDKKDHTEDSKAHHATMSIDDFVEECKAYAKSIDCFLDGGAVSALYEKAEEMKDDNIPLTAENAEALIEEAADRAEKPKLFSKPKYDKDGSLIIKEEHFNF